MSPYSLFFLNEKQLTIPYRIVLHVASILLKFLIGNKWFCFIIEEELTKEIHNIGVFIMTST